MAKAPAPPVDWQGVQAAYCAGVLPISRILEIYKISRPVLMGRASTESWERDLAGALRNEVRRQLVSGATDADLEPYLRAQAAAILRVVEDHRGTAADLRGVLSRVTREMMTLFELGPDEEGKIELPLHLALILGKSGVPAALDTLASALQRIVEMESKMLGLHKLFPEEPTKIAVAGVDSGTTVTVYLPDNNRGAAHREPVRE